jgi:TolA-binding protein
LEKNPNNGDTMVLLARLLSKFQPTDEGERLYRKGMDILSKTRPKEAAAAFKVFYGIYLRGADPETMLRLATFYHQQNDYEWATRCLGLLSDDPQTPPALREKAMFQCARQMELIGNPDMALHYYRLFANTYPTSPLHAKALARLNPV